MDKRTEAIEAMIARGDFEEGLVWDVSYSEARIRGLGGGLKNRTDRNIAPTITAKQDGNHEPKILEENKMEKKLRIRKLTEGECIRLMGFEKKDTQAMKDAGLSKSIIYHSAGDSIVTTCLVGIFGQLLGKDHRKITEDYSDRLSNEENGSQAQGNL